MSSLASSLNLRPKEKRVIVVLGVIVFVVLNFVFVFPHFSDWGKIKKDLLATQAQTRDYQGTIDKDRDPSTNGWSNSLVRLKSSKDGKIPLFSEIALQETVSSEARAYGIIVQNYNTSTAKRLGPATAASKYFESQSLRIVTQSTEKALVDFLYNIGNNPAMIRVQELSLRPQDANRFQLAGQITLTADYEKSGPTNAAPKAPPVNIPKGPPKTNAAPAATTPARDNRPGARGNQTATNQPPARRGPSPPVMPPIPMPGGRRSQ